MQTPAITNSRLYRIFDVLASRIGSICVVGMLVGVCIGVAVYIQSVVSQIEQDYTIFKDAQVRNGYVAMSDISRLVLVAQNAALIDEMTPALASNFVDATDILWVRTDNFLMVKNRGPQFQSGDASVASLKAIVAIADTAISESFPNQNALVQDLLVASDAARANLVLFMDDIRRQGDRVLVQ